MNINNIKYNLAAAYQILAFLKFDDHTYTHLSAKAKDSNHYYIAPFGLRFEEVTQNNLLTVDFDGNIIAGNALENNTTGYIIHSSIYKARTDINCIFHIHTPANVAISASLDGLLPLSQWALHFYDKVSYHNYNSLALNAELHGANIAKDLGENNVMFLRNHGVITAGCSIHETMFYTYHLEQACKTQCLLHGDYNSLVKIPKAICKQSVKDLLSFEKDLGLRDWQAWLRLLEDKII